MKYIISTLGCKVNQYETQAIESILCSRGHIKTNENETADVVIVNTCAVTSESERKCRQEIRKLKEENQNCILAVCGCYSQIAIDDMEKLGADVIYGSNDRIDFVSSVENAYFNNEKKVEIDDPFKRFEFEDLPSGSYSGRTRAMLKVQDGCVNFCSYCIIPYTRGRLRSLSINKAVDEAERIYNEGYSELVITGIEISSYGDDLHSGEKLQDLICAVADSVPELRIRLGSLEPTIVTEEFCSRLSQRKNICRHFHLALQSGCTETLKRMNRKYSTEVFYEKVQLLRKYFPKCGITTDLIVGFPGESEEEFENTLKFLDKCEFSQVHIFPYSRRKGTPADSMPNQITRIEKAARSKRAKSVTNKTRKNYMESFIGETLPVLFETNKENTWEGHSDTYLLVQAEGENLRGLVKNVKILSVKAEKLVGVIV